MNKKQRKKELLKERSIPSIVSTGWPSYEYKGEKKYSKPHGKGKIKFLGPLLLVRLNYEIKTILGTRHKNKPPILDHEYEGEFKKGKKNGMGTFTNYHTGHYPNNYEYVGEFRDDKFEGKGSQNFPDGTKIVGQWKEGFCIKGHRVYPSGEKTNIKTIEIKLDIYPNYWKNKQGLYEGEIKKGKPHGKGRAFLKLKKGKNMHYDDALAPNGGWITWIGEWKDGYLDGKGVSICQRGNTYEDYYYLAGPQKHIHVFDGEWKKGLRHGKGVLKDVRDHIYFEGEFKDDYYFNGVLKELTYDGEIGLFDKETITTFHEHKRVDENTIYLVKDNPPIDESKKN